MPWPDEPAPDFKAMTTHALENLPDHRRQWLFPFSHPADPAPICATELIGIAGSYPRFQALERELRGLSIDSTFAHIAWTRKIKERLGVKSLLPIIEDLSKKVARARHSGGSGERRPPLLSKICIQTLTRRGAACARRDRP